MIGDNADTSTGMGAIGRMQVVVRCERVSHLYLCTPERQSLCESHRQRRWLTHWSYRGQSPEIKQQIVDMALNASGIRDTARVLHISTNTVMTELKKRHLHSST